MTGPIRLRRIDAPPLPPGAVLRVQHTLLPLLWWRGVPVLREISLELTVFERYLLEMALDLDTLSDADLEEVLDLPYGFLNRGVWRLIAAGALHREGTAYRVVPAVARKLLEARVLPRRVHSTADFVLLPRTGDLLALAPGRGSWLAEADRQRRRLPTLTAPAPADLWYRGRAEYLAERVRQSDVDGSDSGIAEVLVPEHDDDLLPPIQLPQTGPAAAEAGSAVAPRGCRAYRCEALVSATAAGLTVDATLMGGPADADQFTLTADLTGADNLVQGWLRQLDTLDSESSRDTAWRAINQADCGYQRAERTGPSSWVYYVDSVTARAIAATGQSLVEPAGIEVANDQAILEAHVRLAPADALAEALFARDLAIASLVVAADPVAQIGVACAEAVSGLAADGGAQDPAVRAAFAAAAVRERIWQLGLFRLVYRLRGPEDFGYE